MPTVKGFKRKYLLKDGRVYWHRLYYDFMPSFMTDNSPPLGSYNYAYYVLHPHKYVQDLYYEAKYFIQRGTRGYSDRDVWSIDWFLTSIMPGMLQQLKRTTHGAPVGVGPKRWAKKLDRLTEMFMTARKIQNYDIKPKEMPKTIRQFRKDFEIFGRYFFNLWD